MPTEHFDEKTCVGVKINGTVGTPGNVVPVWANIHGVDSVAAAALLADVAVAFPNDALGVLGVRERAAVRHTY